jgi:hypothetical protein
MLGEEMLCKRGDNIYFRRDKVRPHTFIHTLAYVYSLRKMQQTLFYELI